MKLIQNSYCASYGSDDTLLASVDDIRKFAGRSALTAIDAIDIEFTRRQVWKPNRNGREFTANITRKDRELGNVSESFFCSPYR